MAQQQGQDALADAAEADDHETARKGNVFLVEHETSAAAGEAKRYGRPPAMSRRARPPGPSRPSANRRGHHFATPGDCNNSGLG